LALGSYTPHVVPDIHTIDRLLSLGWTNPVCGSLIIGRLRRPLFENPMCVAGRNIPVLYGSEMSMVETRFRRSQYGTVGSRPLCRRSCRLVGNSTRWAANLFDAI